MTNGKRLPDIEDAEEEQGDENVLPVWMENGAEEGDADAGDFVDDDKSWVFAAAFTGGNGSGGDTERNGQRDASEGADQQGLRAGVEIDGGGEEKRGGD